MTIPLEHMHEQNCTVLTLFRWPMCQYCSEVQPYSSLSFPPSIQSAHAN